MEDKDYEKAKQECWKEYAATFGVMMSMPNKAFEVIFSRAYRLGMEAAKEDMLTANVDSLEERQPKFKIGDKAIVQHGIGKCEVVTVVYCDSSDNTYRVEFANDNVAGGLWYAESDLEPYTEPQKDKVFDNIVKQGFRNERRLNIATQILCAIIPMFDNKYGESELTKDGEQTIVRNSFRLADMMIEESEKKEGN